MEAIESQVATEALVERRFLFSVPSENLYLPFKAVSRLDAQHQLINSRFAPYYGQAILLTADD